MNELLREMRGPVQSDPPPYVSPKDVALEWIADGHPALSHIEFRSQARRRAREALGWDVPSSSVTGQPAPIPITQEMMDLAYATYREFGVLSDVLKALVPLIAVEMRKLAANRP